MTEEPIEVFFSYSRRDEKFKDELEKRLSVLQRQGIVSNWNDRMIEPGSEWAREIDTHLNSADVILLMVSPDFLASNYCWDVEVRKAMQRHAKGDAYVIPVILRRTDWDGTPFAKFQALPTDAQPIASWNDQDEAFYDVIKGIKVAISNLYQIRQRKETEREAQEKARLEAEERKQQDLQRQAEAEVQARLLEKRQLEHQSRGALLEQPTNKKARHIGTQQKPTKLKYLLLIGSACGVILSLALIPPTITPEGLIYSASEKMRKGDKVGALAELDRAINFQAHDKYTRFTGYKMRGELRHDLGDKTGAISDYDAAIKLYPDRPYLYYQRGLIHKEQGEKQRAIADLQKAADLYQQGGYSSGSQEALEQIKAID